MFDSASRKLEDCRTLLENLKKASDAPTFSSLFNSFLNAARAITNALQKDGSKVDGFDDWYSKEQAEMRSDELLRFIHEARIEDFHQGKHRVIFSTQILHLSTTDAGPPPAPTAVIAIGADGPFWIVEKGTPRERRIPVEKCCKVMHVSIDHPPTSHRNKKLDQDDPITICQLTIEYMENLVFAAREKFNQL